LARPIATFMNVAIDLTYSRVLKIRLKSLIAAFCKNTTIG